MKTGPTSAAPFPIDRLPVSWRRALLPINGNKIPSDPTTGQPLKGWQKAAPGHFPEEVLQSALALGLRLGPISGGTLALDFDGAEAEATFQKLYGRPSSDLPPSISWTSGRPDRRQVAFLVPELHWDRLAKRKAKVAALEHRWDGQQSVICGVHPETRGYHWVKGCAPGEVELAEAPAWLLENMPCKTSSAATPLKAVEAPEPINRDPMPFREFISKAAKDLIDSGSRAGSCNDDGLKISLELVAVDNWLTQQGERPDETARDAFACYLSHCDGSINGEPFDKHAAWVRFDGAAARDPLPSTPVGKLQERLAFHRRDANCRTDRAKATGGGKASGTAQNASRRWREKNYRRLSHDRSMKCFDRCVEVQARQQRNSFTRRIRLLRVASDLGFSKYVNRQEIAQRVLEAKDRQQGHQYQGLTAADRIAMKRPTVAWLLRDMIPENDMSILGGRSKVGKTRLAVGIAGAVLDSTEMLGFQATAQRPVILVTDDQADGDTADMLTALNLWGHPGLIWSQHFRLTESNLDGLLADIKANPGALVILDSLRSISRSLEKGENDPEIGAILYDLKASVIDAGGTLLLVHHANKGDGVGMEALSGHNAISGAANTLITLHYLPDETGRPVKDSPQRRLVREARSGPGFDLVVNGFTAGSGGLHRVSTFSEWQQQAQQGEQAIKRTNGLTTTQREVLEVLDDFAEKTPGRWLTRREVCEAVGVAWINRGRDKEGQRISRALVRLADLRQIHSQRAGTEVTYQRPSHEAPMTVMTVMPTSHTNRSDGITASDDTDESDDKTQPFPSLDLP